MARASPSAQAGLLTANSAELRDAVVALGADPAKFDLILYGTDPNELRPDSTGLDVFRATLARLRRRDRPPSARSTCSVWDVWCPKRALMCCCAHWPSRCCAAARWWPILIGTGDAEAGGQACHKRSASATA